MRNELLVCQKHIKKKKCYGVKCSWGQMFVGRITLKRVVHGVKGPWGKLSMGKCLWGKMTMRRVSMRLVVRELKEQDFRNCIMTFQTLACEPTKLLVTIKIQGCK
jgi:hypothetical protein